MGSTFTGGSTSSPALGAAASCKGGSSGGGVVRLLFREAVARVGDGCGTL